MPIHAIFDSGNIEYVSSHDALFQLRLRKDTQAKYQQWFYFAVSNQKGIPCRFEILDADKSSYPEAWAETKAVMSVDRRTWTRVSTRYENGKLIIEHAPSENLVFYAYFAPYAYEDYLNWIAQNQARCQTTLLTTTAEGRLLHLMQIGTPAPHKRKCWFIARQHSGEAMASWFVEGLFEHLLVRHAALIDQAVFYVVPLMNPDGVFHGNLRANTYGLDLNRQWQHPDPAKCPEVFYTREKMRETGVDFFLDIHGDEAIPYVFLADAGDNLHHSERQKTLENLYREALLAESSEFQTQYGYEKEKFSESTPTLACNHVAEAFDCLAFTLEMPFKDNANLPDPLYGWSPERCKKLSCGILDALSTVLPKLR